jgi:hypothetical protein
MYVVMLLEVHERNFVSSKQHFPLFYPFWCYIDLDTSVFVSDYFLTGFLIPVSSTQWSSTVTNDFPCFYRSEQNTTVSWSICLKTCFLYPPIPWPLMIFLLFTDLCARMCVCVCDGLPHGRTPKLDTLCHDWQCWKHTHNLCLRKYLFHVR